MTKSTYTQELGFILIPEYSVLRVALTTAISVVFINILRLIEVYYFERIHSYDRNFAKPFIAGILSLSLVLFLNFMIPANHLVYDLIYGVLFGLIFFSTLVVVKLEEDLFVLNLLNRKLKFA